MSRPSVLAATWPVHAPAVRVHVESLTNRAVFHITEKRLQAALQRHPDLVRSHISRGENLEGLAGVLSEIDVLLTSEFVLSDAGFPRTALARLAPRLRWIHVTNAGIEKLLPLDWLPRNVTLTNSSGAHFVKAKEFAAMALLMLNAKLPRIIHNQSERVWEKLLSSTIAGKTLCVVGVGGLGRAFVNEGKRLGLKVLGVRRSNRPQVGVDRMYPTSALGEALAQADFVVVCAPLTAETEHLIGEAEFTSMRRDVGFVNVARAGVVDYESLQANLRSGHVGGAILDVFRPEPLPAESPLWRTPNLVIMPHVAMDDSERFLDHCLDIGFNNLRRYLQGKRLKNIVSRSKGY